MTAKPTIERLEIEDPFTYLIDADRTQRYTILDYGPQHYYPKAIVFGEQRVGELINTIIGGLSLHHSLDKPKGLRVAPVAERVIKATQELRPAIYFSSLMPDPRSPYLDALSPSELAEASETYILRINGVLGELGSPFRIPRQ